MTLSVTIPDSVTTIKSYVFQRCFSLVSVTIPNSVISIGTYVFRVCSSLTTITIPNSVTSIGSYAFEGCSKLTSVELSNSISFIGDGVFSDCPNLCSVTYYGKEEPEYGNNVFPNNSLLKYINVSCRYLKETFCDMPIMKLNTDCSIISTQNIPLLQHRQHILFIRHTF